MTTITEAEVSAIKAAASDERALAEVALCDAVAAFIRACTHRRTTRESVQLLSNWRATFERLEKRP